MDDKQVKMNLNVHASKRKACPMPLASAVDFFVQIPHRLQNLKLQFNRLVKNEFKFDTTKPLTLMKKDSYAALDVRLDNQLQAWKENPEWVDQPPEVKVTVPKGSLCNLKVKFNVGLPPDAIYNIVTDPNNKRVFKNIKEVISRRVVVDEGHRQVVEVEQAAIWRFLWWSGTISVHVFVDQNREDHTVKFKQGKSGFMERFEGCWRVEPLFVDEESCFPFKPRTWADYESCTRGKGRVGSVVSLDQLIQPALVPPPPISWYLRGITARTTEMLITDLLAEAARLRGEANNADHAPMRGLEASYASSVDCSGVNSDVKARWRRKRCSRRQRTRDHCWYNTKL